MTTTFSEYLCLALGEACATLPPLPVGKDIVAIIIFEKGIRAVGADMYARSNYSESNLNRSVNYHKKIYTLLRFHFVNER